jgi:hypothetical protein
MLYVDATPMFARSNTIYVKYADTYEKKLVFMGAVFNAATTI